MKNQAIKYRFVYEAYDIRLQAICHVYMAKVGGMDLNDQTFFQLFPKRSKFLAFSLLFPIYHRLLVRTLLVLIFAL